MLTKTQAQKQIASALKTDLAGYNVQVSDIRNIAQTIYNRAFISGVDVIMTAKLQKVYNEVMRDEFGIAVA